MSWDCGQTIILIFFYICIYLYVCQFIPCVISLWIDYDLIHETNDMLYLFNDLTIYYIYMYVII